MGQYRHTWTSVHNMSENQRIENTTQLQVYDGGARICNGDKFQYFFDNPKRIKGPRLNIMGHSALGCPIFRGKLPGSKNMSAENFTKSVKILLKKYPEVKSIRLIACHAGKNHLAQIVADELRIPVKASLGTVNFSELLNTAPLRHWIDRPDYNKKNTSEKYQQHLEKEVDYGRFEWFHPKVYQTSYLDDLIGIEFPAIQPDKSALEREWDTFTNNRISSAINSTKTTEWVKFDED
ncbi:hypothetical protein FE392_06040 [Xenorhabdus sp. 12]|uniref:Peptidase C80 domain-containing protein n=1 Tax=Xenorhabdus santafensis TaxID=2582833 RepID=A0ABU4S7Y7_9GAMM|nr:hypothetical protein [Xenorhabdus sp. 12]MDX7986892.1 hypothetical protein [Xenorhabdus sp. 12]